jgi:hypothetical protein
MTRHRLRARILDFMGAHEDGSRDDASLDALLDEVAGVQARAIPAYARLARRAGGPLPAAVPTDVFRFARLAIHSDEEDLRVFRTSGTTQHERGAHSFRDLSLYDRAAEIQARRFLFPDERPLRFVLLSPSAIDAPDSSLSYMLDLLATRFCTTSRHYLSRGSVLAEELEKDLRDAEAERVPVAILGTSFALVHAEDALGTRSFSLPAGSRLMQTGGFKGRSRELSPSEMRTRLCSRYGIPEERIVSEYGMTELSSQFYEPSLRASLLGEPAPPRRYVPAPWVRAFPVDPESLAPVPDGELGILRIDDLANLDSIACIQTSDLARRVDGALELVGRAPGATPRGCSLAIDEMLGGSA